MIRPPPLRIALTAGLCLMMAGCLSTQKPVSQRIFTLTGCQSGDQSADNGAPQEGGRGPVIRVDSVRGPAWLHETRIVYRLDYVAGRTQSSYGRARWAEPPVEMITSALRTSLASHGPWRAVVGPDVEAHVDWTLSVTLDELTHVFTSPEKSDAALQASLLVVGASGNVLAQQEVRLRVPADAADSAGGVAAMSRAETALCSDARTLLERVYHNRWTNDTPIGIENRQ